MNITVNSNVPVVKAQKHKKEMNTLINDAKNTSTQFNLYSQPVYITNYKMNLIQNVLIYFGK